MATTLPSTGPAPDPPSNPLGRVDHWQRQRTVTAFPVAVWKKFGDDNGGKLAAQLTYKGFLSLFPLLLVTVTILGYALDGRPDLQEEILDSAVAQIPVIGDQLQNNVESLTGNFWALAVGIAVALWGGLGVTQAAQDVMATVWSVPRRHRPNFFLRLARGVLLLVIVALAVISTALLTSLATLLDGLGRLGRIGLTAAALVLNVGWFALSFRALTPKKVTWRDVLPGSAVAAVGFQVLLVVGATIVDRQLKDATASYGVFGVVLGLMAWLALLSTVFIYAAEINPVLKSRLWPRSMFTAGLTEQDRIVLTDSLGIEVRAPHQSVTVTFESPPAPDDGEEPATPATPAGRTHPTGAAGAEPAGDAEPSQ